MEQNHLNYLDELKFNQGFSDEKIEKFLKGLRLTSAFLFADEYDMAED